MLGDKEPQCELSFADPRGKRVKRQTPIIHRRQDRFAASLSTHGMHRLQQEKQKIARFVMLEGGKDLFVRE